jgi:hypothetical protein
MLRLVKPQARPHPTCGCGMHQMIDPQVQQLLDAQDRIIEQLKEQNELLKQLAESRRLAFLHQCKELADLRKYHFVNNNRWGFLLFMLVGDIWPFAILYRRFER